jgi:hypothetical protein
MPVVTRVLLIVLIASATALAGCGESKQDKAKSTVCDARADIRKQVDDLTSLTIATASVDGVKGNVQAIRDDLKKITDAQGTLSDDRRSQVQAANKAFTSQVTEIAKGLQSNLSLSQAGTQIRTAAKQLGDAYAQSLGKLDCS